MLSASQYANGCINQLASALRRVGYAVEVTSSSAAAGAARGSFSSLRHTFLTVRLDEGGAFVDHPRCDDLRRCVLRAPPALLLRPTLPPLPLKCITTAQF